MQLCGHLEEVLCPVSLWLHAGNQRPDVLRPKGQIGSARSFLPGLVLSRFHCLGSLR